MFRNKNLLVISVIAVVNALGYGIIIPILYTYSRKFGLSDFQNGLLFATFSLCAFISTPIIGRMSDKYGRKPMLLISLIGTLVSFLTMAFAPSAIFLFLARALDGITAGNISVAQAVISDTTEPKDRAKGFGLIGAAFGFGFIFGPAISAVTYGVGMFLPFLIAATVTFVAIILVWKILPETNAHIGEVKAGKVFDLHGLARMLTDKNVGLTLLISFVYATAFALFIYAYQPVSVEVLHMGPAFISVNFTLIGIVGLISQGVLIQPIIKKFKEKHILLVSQIIVVIVFTGFFFTKVTSVFYILSMAFALGNAFVNPLLNTMLSREVDERSQGSIMGVNASYVSLGNIIGPILGGFLASFLIPLPMLFGALVVGITTMLSFRIPQKPAHPQDAF